MAASHNDEFAGKVQSDQEKRLDYLVKQTELYAHFLTNGSKVPTKPKRARKDRAEDKENVPNNNNSFSMASKNQPSNSIFQYESTPSYIKNGEMREYQVKGLNWMISLYENSISGILADEMGLGKTLQSISFLGHLKHVKKIAGRHLVVGPKSTLENWMDEFKKWCPSLQTISFIGSKDERTKFKRDVMTRGKWDVCVTTYEMCIREKPYMNRFQWKCLVLDEAHRIKNENTVLAGCLREFSIEHRLLLTGTPLQNTLHELWALLNFLLPDIFNSSKDFDAWFNIDNCTGDGAHAQRLKDILKPFLLRRLKSEVEKSLKPKIETKIYVGLSKLQREWYKKVLTNNIEVVNGQGESKPKVLMNLLTHLRKCANHPYLFPDAEPGPPYTTDLHLVQSAGKLNVLDKLLPKLQAQGSRVLIFSAFTTFLNILEDYCNWRGYQYSRLDGYTRNRHRLIEEFNAPNSKTFIFMLTTRAGGLGINLTTADVVILYDSDWNPQMDLQAMDRAHRIGQQKEVRVFRLITEDTIEEIMVKRAEQKLFLNQTVIHNNKMSAEELLSMIRFGANKVITSDDSDLADEDIDTILKRSADKTAKENTQMNKLPQSYTKNTNSGAGQSMYQFEGEDYRRKNMPDSYSGLSTRKRRMK